MDVCLERVSALISLEWCVGEGQPQGDEEQMHDADGLIDTPIVLL